jgi:hypothetical protein
VSFDRTQGAELFEEPETVDRPAGAGHPDDNFQNRPPLKNLVPISEQKLQPTLARQWGTPV